MSSKNRSLLFAVIVVFCCKLLAACSAGAEGPPFFAIAHMTNTVSAVQWAVSQGANALEVDLQFNTSGYPMDFQHGFPCDCTCSSMVGVCYRLGNLPCSADTASPVLLQYIAKQPIALLVIDTKLGWPPFVRPGEVIKLLEDNLFRKGYKGKVIIGASKLDGGVASIAGFDYIAAVAQWAQLSVYNQRIYFTIDGEENNIGAVLNALLNGRDIIILPPPAPPIRALPIVSKNVVYGTGTTACLSTQYYNTILTGAANKAAGVIGLNYIWTIDVESSMAQYIRAGAQGIITNRPDMLVSLLKSKGIPLADYNTPIPPSSNHNVIVSTPTCKCNFHSRGCVISSPAPAGLACDCEFFAGACLSSVVACKDNSSPFCTGSGTARGNCLQGGGNCDGY